MHQCQPHCYISRLPIELLLEIFYGVVAATLDRNWGATTCLSHVCRAWRKDAISDPILWRDVRFHEGCPPLDVCHELLSRSAPAYLKVWLSDLRGADLGLIKEILTPHSHRIESLNASFTFSPLFMSGTTRADLSCLRSLHLESPPPTLAFGVPLISMVHPLQRLQKLSSFGLAYPIISQYFRPTITVLNLRGDNADRQDLYNASSPSTSQFLDALNSMPLIEVLHTDNVFGSYVPSTTSVHSVELRYLRSLKMREDAVALAEMLDSLTFPICALHQSTSNSDSVPSIEGKPLSRRNITSADAGTRFLKAVLPKLRGHGISGSSFIPPNTLRLRADRDVFPRRVIIEAMDGETGHSMQFAAVMSAATLAFTLDCISSDEGGHVLSSIHALDISSSDREETDYTLPFHFFRNPSVFKQLRALSFNRTQGLINSLVNMYRSSSHAQVFHTFPELHTLIIIQARFRNSIPSHQAQSLHDPHFINALERWLRLRKEAGIQLTKLVIQQATGFQPESDLRDLRLHVVELEWDGESDFSAGRRT